MQATFNKMLSSQGILNEILTFKTSFFGDRAKYIEKLENVNKEHIILENAI